MKTVEALLTWSICKAVGEVHVTGNNLYIQVTYKNRYYSPVFWVIAILFLPLYIFKGGIIEWAQGLAYSIGANRTIKASFKDGLSKMQKKYATWLLIYTGVA